MEQEQSGGRDAAIWRVIAEFTRENNARDLRTQELVGKVDRLSDLSDDLERVLKRQDDLVALVGSNRDRIVELEHRLKHPILNQEELLSIRRLLDAMERTRRWELLSQEEVQAVRTALSTISRTHQEYEDYKQKVVALERWQAAHERSTVGRMRIVAEMREDQKGVMAWRTAHEETVRGLQDRMYKIEVAIDDGMRSLREFRDDWMERVKKTVQEWEEFRARSTDHAVWRYRYIISTVVGLVLILLSVGISYIVNHHW